MTRIRFWVSIPRGGGGRCSPIAEARQRGPVLHRENTTGRYVCEPAVRAALDGEPGITYDEEKRENLLDEAREVAAEQSKTLEEL